MIYFRQEQLELAEFHFKKAVQIHKENSVLRYHMGMVYFAQNRIKDALECAKHAIKLCETNNMAVFLKARCLYFLGAHQVKNLTLDSKSELFRVINLQSF